jgi:hypothetical protein
MGQGLKGLRESLTLNSVDAFNPFRDVTCPCARAAWGFLLFGRL